MIADYFAPELGIVNRLKSEIPEVSGRVFTMSELEDTKEAQQGQCAIYVVHAGDNIDSRSSNGEVQQFDQEYFVILAVRNAAAQANTDPLRVQAGPIMVKILKALQGFSPADECGPLRRTNAPSPGYSPGYGYFPLAIVTRLIV